jgi:hypothetical protein
LGSYSTVAVGCDAVTGTAFPFKHQQPVTQWHWVSYHKTWTQVMLRHSRKCCHPVARNTTDNYHLPTVSFLLCCLFVSLLNLLQQWDLDTLIVQKMCFCQQMQHMQWLLKHSFIISPSSVYSCYSFRHHMTSIHYN